MVRARKNAFLKYLEEKYKPALVNASKVFKMEGSISSSLKKMDSQYSSVFDVDDISVIEALLNFIKSPPRGAIAGGRPVQNLDLKSAFLNHYKGFLEAQNVPSNDIDEDVFVEGIVKESLFFRRKRNRALRDECIKKYGHVCYVCGFDFELHYGPRGHMFIEVHHLHPMANYDEAHEVSVDDMRPLCSNCHSMIHKDPVDKLTDIEVFKKEYIQRHGI